MKYGKQILLIAIILILFGIFSFSPSYLSKQSVESEIYFHLPSKNITGTIGGLTTYSLFDPENLHLSNVKAEVESKTLNTGNIARNLRFTSKKFLHAKKFPKIIFKSEKVVKVEDSYVLLGQLSIKNQQKKVAFTITHKNDTVFGVTSINLTDFGMQLSQKRYENKLDIYVKVPYSSAITANTQ